MNTPKVHHPNPGDVVAWYEYGETLRQIAVRYNVSPSTIVTILERAGQQRRGSGKRDESPQVYRGGWVRHGLIMRPLIGRALP